MVNTWINGIAAELDSFAYGKGTSKTIKKRRLRRIKARRRARKFIAKMYDPTIEMLLFDYQLDLNQKFTEEQKKLIEVRLAVWRGMIGAIKK